MLIFSSMLNTKRCDIENIINVNTKFRDFDKLIITNIYVALFFEITRSAYLININAKTFACTYGILSQFVVIRLTIFF